MKKKINRDTIRFWKNEKSQTIKFDYDKDDDDDDDHHYHHPSITHLHQMIII